MRGRIKFGSGLEPPPRYVFPDPELPYRALLPCELAAKARVYVLWRASGMSKVALAQRVEINEKEVRRVLDPDHTIALDRMDEAARVSGHQLVVGAVAA